MASKRRPHNEHILQELILHSDSDTTVITSDSVVTYESESGSDSEVNRQMYKSQCTVSARPE
jgi:hypothetical protein